jgi:xylulokinase
MQIIADVTGRPVLGSDDDAEASLGAARLAALGTGVVADAEALRGWVHLRERARPDPGERARYDRAHAQYIAAYPALRGVMHALRD